MMTQATGSEVPPPAAGAGRESAPRRAGQRLANLNKLYHVPVFALRDLLQRRAPGRKFSDLRQADLVAAADRLPAQDSAEG